MDIKIFFPVFVCYGFSILNILFFKLSRNFRKYISIISISFVLISSIYIFEGYLPLFSQWEKLSMFFAILISSISFLSIVYSQWYNPSVNFVYDSLFFIFVGSMIGVVLSSSLIIFYIFWEIMTISSFFLVLYENTDEAKNSSIKYIIMTGTGSIFLLFGIIGITFAENSDLLKHILFLSIFIGAGVKSGLFPLNSWLPETYSAAPTPISTIFSGTMSKIGIYAFIKFYFVIFQPNWSIVWENIMVIIGMITLLSGVLLALIQHDIKRLLAYHSISQIGYIFLGIATGTSIGLLGALYHLLNHALFKSLLFLGSGVLIRLTGSRELEKYGGFSSILPFTFLTFSIASFSISGLPPFNGFVSKWIICQALFEKKTGISILAMIISLVGSALTLASFIKVLNDSFLGVGKGNVKEKISEKTSFLIIPLGTLAFGCLFFGFFPGFVTNKIFAPITGNIQTLNIKLINIVSFWGYISILITFFLYIYLSKSGKKFKEKNVFVGGEYLPSTITDFDGSHFYKTVYQINGIKKFYELEKKGILDSYSISERLFNFTSKISSKIEIFVRDEIYKRGRDFIYFVTEKFKSFQNGLLPRYILWIIAGIIFIMEVLKRW
ncbi:MAG: complex I subunit 5 family protein [Candidatus Ratteibacteria bacterium]